MASFGDHVLRLFKKIAKQDDQRDNADPETVLDGSNEARIKQQAERERAAAAEMAESDGTVEPEMPSRNPSCLQGNFATGAGANREGRKKTAEEFQNIIHEEAERAISFNDVISHRRLDESDEVQSLAQHEDIESPLDETGNATLFAGKLLGDQLSAENQLAPGKTVNPTEESFKQVAACPTTSPSTLTWLSTQPSAEIRAAVASNHHVPQDTLRKLSNDGDSAVRLAVASNKRTPDDILKHLTHDENKLVSGEAFSSLTLREKASNQSAGPAFNKFAPPKVNPVQTKVPIIGGSTSTKIPALPAPLTANKAALPPSTSPTPSPVSPPLSAPLSSPSSSPIAPPAASTPASVDSISVQGSAKPTQIEAASSQAAAPMPQHPAPNFTKTSSARSGPSPAPAPVAAVISSMPTPTPTTSSNTSAPAPPTPAPEVKPAPKLVLEPSELAAETPVTPKMVTPRSLPKSSVKSTPPANLAATASSNATAKPMPSGTKPAAFSAIPTAPAASSNSNSSAPAPAGSEVSETATAPAPAAAPVPAPAPVQTPAPAPASTPVSSSPAATADGHNLLTNHKFKTTSNHLVASYTDLDAISVEMDNRSPNTWLSLNSEGAIKAYKKQKDTVKDVKMNLGAHNTSGPKRTSPVVNITPNATASETITFLKVVAGRISTPPGRLIELAEHANEEVRAAVAENANLPNEAFLQLAKDSVSTVKLRLIDNPNCPTEVLGALQNDSDPYVAFEARNALKRLGAGLLKEREQNQFRGGSGGIHHHTP